MNLEVWGNYNLPKSENSRQSQGQVEKEQKDEIEHFGLISYYTIVSEK